MASQADHVKILMQKKLEIEADIKELSQVLESVSNTRTATFVEYDCHNGSLKIQKIKGWQSEKS